MRRRSILKKQGILTLSTSSKSVSGSSGSTTFYVYLDGTPLTQSGVTISSSQSFATTSYNSSSGVATITYKSNPYSARSATITVSYEGKQKTLTLTLSTGTLTLSSPSSALSGFNGTDVYLSVYVGGKDNNSAKCNVSVNVNWISISSNYASSIRLICSENNSDSTRSAVITASLGGQTTTVTISQSNIMSVSTLIYDGTVDGYKYIEIGGLKWAINNVGASSDGDYGTLLRWSNSPDIVTTNMGGGWRMPTANECTTLINGGYQWGLLNSKKGIFFKDSNGKYIFFGLRGAEGSSAYQNGTSNVWTSTGSSNSIRFLAIYSSGPHLNSTGNTSMGVRGVHD